MTFHRQGMEVANVRGWRIASIERTCDAGPWIMWWGPSNGGYDDSLEHAGVYELDGLLADPDYYGRRNNLCVPDYVARRLACGRDRAKNLVANWEALFLAALFRSGKVRWPTPYDPKPVNEEAKRFNRKFPVGSIVRIVAESGVFDVAVRSPARNVDARAMVGLAGLGAVKIEMCCDPATTCKQCGDYLVDKYNLEWDSDEYPGKKLGDCRSCPVAPQQVTDTPGIQPAEVQA